MQPTSLLFFLFSIIFAAVYAQDTQIRARRAINPFLESMGKRAVNPFLDSFGKRSIDGYHKRYFDSLAGQSLGKRSSAFDFEY